MTLMVTSPVLLASSWEQVKTSFERLDCFGVIGMEWERIAKKSDILHIFLNQKNQEHACLFDRFVMGHGVVCMSKQE